MARLQDFQTVTPTSSDKLLVVQSQGQGLVSWDSKLDYSEAYTNPTVTNLTLQNGAENYSFNSYYYKKLGRVTVNISIKSLSSSSTVIARLPAGFRPRADTSFLISDGTATGSCGLNIATNGNMTVWKSSTQYAIGEISFDAFN